MFTTTVNRLFLCTLCSVFLTNFVINADENPNLRANFYLYTQKNRDNFIQLRYGQENRTRNLVDTTKPTAFIVHGFDSNPNNTNFKDIKNDLLNLEDLNVFLVDWTQEADQGINYFRAVGYVRHIGRMMGEFMRNVGINPKNAHCIGHSLGSHVCGFAGKYSQLKRISALDPAGPLFGNVDQFNRLDKADAIFVDVIHTTSGIGLGKSIGHKDFYVNGGRGQPGCGNQFIPVYCSHVRAVDLYAESIRRTDCSFKSVPCTSYDDFKKGKCNCDPSIGCSFMGFKADLNKQEGNFYLNTHSSNLYCIE